MRLLERARLGDRAALDALMARYLPRLERWATGRLPRWARDATDTHDIVQDTLLRTLGRLGSFEDRGEGAFQAYLRQGIMNRIRDELRRTGRRPQSEELPADLETASASPLEEAIGRQTLERYESALERLKPSDREAVIARVEMGCTYEEIADVLAKPSSNAARMAVERALVRLAIEMNESEGAAR